MAELAERFALEDISVAKVGDSFFLEFFPAVYLDEGALFIQRHGLKHTLSFGCVVPFRSLEHLGIARDPWVEIIT